VGVVIRVARVVLAASFVLVAGATPGYAHNPEWTRRRPGVDAKIRPMGPVAPTRDSARLAHVGFADGQGEERFTATVTRNPDTPVLQEPGFTRPDDECAAPVCREVTVDVPDTATKQTLYARVAWENAAQYVHLWGIAPDGTVAGRAQVFDSFDKQIGNALTVPRAEFTVAGPQPGTWRIQVRAVFGYRIDVTGLVAIRPHDPVGYERLDVRTLADRHLTQHLTMNVVFAGRRWSDDDVKEFREQLPTEVRLAVATEVQDECGFVANNGIVAVRSWEVCHFTGTSREGAPGAKPYFEPAKLTFGYRFLEADGTWTRDLFAAMRSVTTEDQPFGSGTFNVTRPVASQEAYLRQYDAEQGRANRGPDAAVTDPGKGDKIDALAVEDWVFDHRLDPKYARSFRDLETGAVTSPRFVDPDPDAYYDPFYTARGHRDLERMPQGPATSLTVFVLDTFSDRDLADQFFRPDAYHFFDVSKRMVDPDSDLPAGPDFGRVWGGRYRFFLHDLGAGPNFYEAASTVVGTVAGSAAYPDGDPPIWDYDNDPRWQGLLVERTARDVATMLLYRFAHAYAYRPIPADVYLLASNIWNDCYANPDCSPEAVTKTDLTKLYDAAWVERNLSAALPGATFTTERSIPGLRTYRELGCAKERAVANPTRTATGSASAVLVPDPNCVARPGDPIQQTLERAKANGDDLAGPGVQDFGVSAHVVRAYVEENRPALAPQPPGQFTITSISAVFPGSTTWFLPVPSGGGVALATPNGEAWGILQNVNEVFKPAFSTDCSRSKPIARGCGITPPGVENDGLSYTTQHEAAHFIGLWHPHDSFTVEKDADGKWQYYGYSYRHYGDFSQAPTTYAGSFAPYSVLDQDLLQRGHAAEYLRQAQDWLADAYLLDGAAGLDGPSALTRRKVAESARWRDLGSALFGCGDYLSAERALRNASLAAQGVFGPVVRPRLLSPGERVLFEVRPQRVYGPDGEPVAGCAGAPGAVRPGQPAPREAPRLPATGPAGLAEALPLLAVTAGAGVLLLRRRLASPGHAVRR
jgi:hypothetical protein